MRSLTSVFIRQSRREMLLFVRQPRLLIQSLVFFLMMLLFFPLTIAPSTGLLKEVAGGLVWLAFLFAVLLLCEGVFQRAFDEGLIEQAWVSGEPLVIMVLATLLVQLVFLMSSVLLFFPIIGVVYGLNWYEGWVLADSFLLGGPALFLIAAFAAALNVGRIQKTTLMALLVLPLVLPIIIFGSGVLRLYGAQTSVSGMMALLAAFSLLCFAGMPYAIAAVLRLRFED